MYELLNDFLWGTGVLFWIALAAVVVLFKLEISYEDAPDADTRK